MNSKVMPQITANIGNPEGIKNLLLYILNARAPDR